VSWALVAVVNVLGLVVEQLEQQRAANKQKLEQEAENSGNFGHHSAPEGQDGEDARKQWTQ
jgi:hypothetical protein